MGAMFTITCAVSFIIVAYFTGACRVPNSVAALGSLRNYADKRHDYHNSRGIYGSINDLINAGLLDPIWTQPVHDNYKFRFQITDQGTAYQATAEPVDNPNWSDGPADRRYFYLDSASGIHWAQSCPALATDPRIGE